jgi:hypothetical protein
VQSRSYLHGRLDSRSSSTTSAKEGVWLDRFEFTPAAATGPTAVITDALCFATNSSWVSGAESEWFYPADYAFVLLKTPSSTGFRFIENQFVSRFRVLGADRSRPSSVASVV